MPELITENPQDTQTTDTPWIGDPNAKLYSPLDDQEDTPMKNACPTGGCPSDTKLNKENYEEMMEKEAKEKKLDLNDPIQRKSVHMAVLPLFRQRVREDKKYTPQDREGPPYAHGPEFIIKDGGIYYPSYQKSLKQIIEDHKRRRSKDYDPKVDATMALMDAAFAQGATHVSHISHNKDGNGNDAIRDKITMVFDPVTGKGKMEIRNIAGELGNLSTKEAYAAINRAHDGFIEGHPTEGIFIFTDAPIPTEQVHGILSSIEQPEPEVRSHDTGRVIPDRTVDATVTHDHTPADEILSAEQSRVQHTENSRQDAVGAHTRQIAAYVKDRVTQGIDGFITYIHDTQKVIGIPPFLQKLLDIPEENYDKQEPVLSTQIPLREIIADEEDSVLPLLLLTEAPVDDKAGDSADVDLTDIWLVTAQNVLSISREQSEQLLTEIVETSRIMHDAMEVVTFVAEENVAIAAGLFALDILTLPEESDENIAFIAEFAASPEQHMETGSLELVTQLPQKDRDFIFSLFTKPDSEQCSIDIRSLVPYEVDVDVLTATIDFIRTIDVLPADEKEPAIIREKEKTLGEIVFLWDFLTVMATQKNREADDKKESITIHSPHELINSAHSLEPEVAGGKENAEHLSFALGIWILLKITGYYANLEFVHSIVAKRESSPLVRWIQKEKPAGFIQKESAPWLLLSIIWYLTMIREQGTTQSQQQNTQHVKQKQMKTPLLVKSYTPEYGIIFAFGS